MNLRVLAIVNPEAGRVRRQAIDRGFLRQLESQVERMVYTEAPGHATALAASAAAAGFGRVVAVGGDGTVAELLSGMDLDRQQLAIVPGGTGNCLAIALGLDTVARALQALAGGRTRPVDLIDASLEGIDGSRSRHLLGSTAGMGYASDVAVFAKQRLSRLDGWAYSVAAPLVRPRARSVELSIDGAPPRCLRITGLLVNNTRDIGTGRPFPCARIDDGLLDAVLFERGWLGQCLHDIQLVTGVRMPGTPQPQVLRQAHLRFTQPERVMLDGDLSAPVTAMTVACRPRALQCLAPPA